MRRRNFAGFATVKMKNAEHTRPNTSNPETCF